MKALRATRPTPSSRPTLRIEEIPTPQPGPNDLLIQIHASFIQPSDILNSQGSFSSTTFPRTLGRDFAGTVVTGPSHLQGKNVYGTSGPKLSFNVDGAQAEYVIVPENGVALMPSNLSFAQAASLGTPLTTANLTLLRAHAKQGETVMVLGATGNVGSLVMQVAKAKYGCKVIGVGRHGTDINSIEDPNLLKAKDQTSGNGPDIVVDTVGDFNLVNAAINVMNKNARMSFISAPRGGKSTVLPVDILDLYRRQISLVGCNSVGIEQDVLAQMLGELGTLIQEGKIKAPDESSMTKIGLEQALAAYEGKIKKAVIVFE